MSKKVLKNAPGGQENNEQEERQQETEQRHKPAGISWNDDLSDDNAGKYVITPIGSTNVLDVK